MTFITNSLSTNRELWEKCAKEVGTQIEFKQAYSLRDLKPINREIAVYCETDKRSELFKKFLHLRDIDLANKGII